MEKKIKKSSRPYYKIMLSLTGLKECQNPQGGKFFLCSNQTVTAEQLNWK
jgi:hypothetical protein